MTRHRCVLNDSNGFSCNVCENRLERAEMEFDRDYLPKLVDSLNDLRLPLAARDRFLDELLTAYVDARMEETNDE